MGHGERKWIWGNNRDLFKVRWWPLMTSPSKKWTKWLFPVVNLDKQIGVDFFSSWYLCKSLLRRANKKSIIVIGHIMTLKVVEPCTQLLGYCSNRLTAGDKVKCGEVLLPSCFIKNMGYWTRGLLGSWKLGSRTIGLVNIKPVTTGLGLLASKFVPSSEFRIAPSFSPWSGKNKIMIYISIYIFKLVMTFNPFP